MESAILSILGVLLGTWLGYRLSLNQSEQTFRRTVLRDIALEYRRLGEAFITGDLDGLLKSGICQCQSNKEFEHVLELIDDLSTKFPIKEDWKPENGNYVKFFARLKEQEIDPLDWDKVMKLKKEFDL